MGNGPDIMVRRLCDGGKESLNQMIAEGKTSSICTCKECLQEASARETILYVTRGKPSDHK